MKRSLLAAVFGATACYAVVAITEPPGPGLDPDSISYLGAAEALVAHGSLRVPFADWSSADSTSPLAHFPPGFSLALAGPLALGAPPEQAARALEAAAAFVTVGGGVWLVAGVAGSGAGALAGIVLLASPSLAFDHWQVLSEPLCLALLVVTLGLMIGAAPPWAYGLAAAAAGLVRYAGAAAMAAAVLWAFGLSGDVRTRLRRGAQAAVPALVIHGAWMLREAAESGRVRTFGLRGALGPSFRQLGETLDGWLAPLVPWPWLQTLLAVAVAALVLAVGLAAARRPAGAGALPGRGAAPRFIAAAGLIAACYAALVLWSRLFVDETIPFDGRLLSPAIMLVELAAVSALGATWGSGGRGARRAAVAVTLLWVGASARSTVEAVGDARDGGWGFASDEWRGSPLAQWLRTEGRAAAIYSDNPATAFALTHRPSRNVPMTLDADSVAGFARAFGRARAVLVRFPFELEAGAPPDSLANRLGLREIAAFPDGAVWESPAPRERPARRGG